VVDWRNGRPPRFLFHAGTVVLRENRRSTAAQAQHRHVTCAAEPLPTRCCRPRVELARPDPGNSSRPGTARPRMGRAGPIQSSRLVISPFISLHGTGSRDFHENGGLAPCQPWSETVREAARRREEPRGVAE